VDRLYERSSPHEILHNGQTYHVKRLDVDPHFLNVFDFPLLKGSRATGLKDPDSLLLTESLADRIFGEDEPLGAMFTTPQGAAFKVTGILQDVPPNSHMKFEFLTAANLSRKKSSGIPGLKRPHSAPIRPEITWTGPLLLFPKALSRTRHHSRCWRSLSKKVRNSFSAAMAV